MSELLYIKEFYIYLLVFLFIAILVSFFTYIEKKSAFIISNFIAISFGVFTVFYLGMRSYDIGVDTETYRYAFNIIKEEESFSIRKDPFYDLISYIFSKTLDFQSLLIFCAFLYVFGALIGLKKIFKKNFYLPFLLFLITPYFFQFGINVMRSGVAASIFLVAIGYYYTKDEKWKIVTAFTLSIFFHISMLLPLLFFYIARYIKNTTSIFIVWLISIVLGVLKINILIGLAHFLSNFTTRLGNYAESEGEQSAWGNFFIFGAFPVCFAVYNIFVLKYKQKFYIRLTNTYMLLHIPYIILIHTEFALRIGYLAEFMMPILLLFPILIEPKIKIKYKRFKISLIILLIFLIKAYKILIL